MTRLPRPVALRAAAVALLTTACGISVDNAGPRPVEDAPADLFASSTVQPPPAEEDPERVYALYFLNGDDRLVRVLRAFDGVPTLQGVLNALVTNPTEEELVENPGIGTRLPPELMPQVAAPPGDDQVLHLMVAPTELRRFILENPDRVVRVYSQIVCTMSELQNIESVQISDEEGTISVVGPDGAPLDRPITPADVNDCKTAEGEAQEAADEAENAENGNDDTTDE